MNLNRIRFMANKASAFAFKALFVLLTTALSTDMTLRLFGFLNARMFAGRFKTVTLFYLADRRYRDSVTFRWYAKWNQWSPVLAGFFLHAHSGGFMLAVGCNEADFCDPANAERLRHVYERTEQIAAMLRVEAASYAGILPSVLLTLGVKRQPIEADRTVAWIEQALTQVKTLTGLGENTTIAVLGSEGHIGSRVCARLRKMEHCLFIELDNRLPPPTQLMARQALAGSDRLVFLNSARNDSIDEYLDLIPSGSVVLDEVYPECSETLLRALKARQIRYFHICGVEAWSLPRFPRAYAGAVPCCAASAAVATTPSWQPEDRAKVVVRES